MQKNSLYYSFLVLVIIAALYSCKKKVDGTVNNQVIETPYSLYFADSAGTLYNSNNGDSINFIVFPSDGYPSRAICISDTNLLWVKINLYLSVYNTNQFNHAYDSVRFDSTHADNSLPIVQNQSMIINVPDESRVYISSNDPNPVNYLGIAYSTVNGILGSWTPDKLVDSPSIMNNPATITSFTELTDNVLIGYDAIHNRSFSKAGASSKWLEQTSATNFLPADGFFTLGSYNNQVIAIDNKGVNGAWYSNDQGATWAQFSGLPAGRPLLCVNTVFNQTLLIGTDSAGVYILNVNTNSFQPDNNGMDNYVAVRGITSKENIYKNNSSQEYVYLATDYGIYQSVDGGHNWIKTIKGNYVNIY